MTHSSCLSSSYLRLSLPTFITICGELEFVFIFALELFACDKYAASPMVAAGQRFNRYFNEAGLAHLVFCELS